MNYLILTAEKYSNAVTNIVGLMLNKFADGFSHQKGAIYGFGENQSMDTKTVLKISNLDEEQLKALDSVQIHNQGEERSVGLFNYEINIRGKSELETASRCMVLKSADILLKKTP